jgi:hypothetical protein
VSRSPRAVDDATTLGLIGDRPGGASRSGGPRRALVASAVTAGLLVAGGGLAIGTGLLGRPGGVSKAGPEASGARGATPSAAASPAPSAESSPTPSGPLAGGWYAGASGLGVADGEFQKWLRQPVTIAGTWADQDARAQERLTPLGTEYRSWTGAMDLAVGGTVLGSNESYSAAARGAYDARWRTAAKTLAARRGKVDAPTFVRPFHEMNGFWYRNWRVSKGNVADYRTAHARYVRILRKAMPSVYISWSPNFRDHSGLPIEQWYPGDDVVDCVAPDYYHDTPKRVTVAVWNATADDVDRTGNPLGVEAWRRFAQKHGKPLCFPETGLKPVGGVTDQPEWVRAFNTWLNAHANTSSWPPGEQIPAEAAGKVLYSVYFNVPHDGLNGFTIYGRGANPKSAKVFRTLEWGREP